MQTSEKPRTVWQLIAQSPGAAVAAALLIVLSALLNVGEVIVLEGFIDGFSAFQWGQSLAFGLALSGVYGFYYIQEPALEYLSGRLRLGFRSALDEAIIGKTARISAAALEIPDNQALLNRLKDAPEKRYVSGFLAPLRILGGTLGMLGVFGLIWRSIPGFLLVILVLLGLMAAVFRLIGRSRVALYRSRQEIGRRSEYLSGLLFDRRLAQEKKLFAYTPYIQELYEDENIRSGRQMLKSVFFSNLVLWIYDNITYLFSASAYLLFLIPLYRGEIELGLYIAIIPALTRLGAFFVEVGSSHLPTWKEYRAALEDMKALYALPEQYYTPDGTPAPEFCIIRGEDICFRYPGQEKPVLDGLSFTFEAGKNYALVGENGCGKTTLMKLLLGFYEPERGRITIDGRDVRELNFGERQQYFSAVFQDFNRYEYSLRENIRLSDSAGEGDIRQAVREAGLEAWIDSLPEGYDTRLGNLEEGGVDLSGGQWQRLSIARLLYRRAGICLWDEPTAAMDPLAESRLYTAFLGKRSPGCANIFVTHRLGAAVSADEICVLDKGRLAERGTHAQLMANADGLYHRMFEAQKGMYTCP